MRKTVSSAVTIAATFLTVIAALTPLSASAREGAQSTGKGIKCYTTVINGVATRVCYKGV